MGVQVAAIESLTSQAGDLSTASNVRLTMKPQLISNASLTPSNTLNLSGLDPNTADFIDASSGSLASFTVTVAGTSQTFSHVIQFGAQGETLAQANLVQWIDVGLKPVRGKQADVAALQISGVTGAIQVFQP